MCTLYNDDSPPFASYDAIDPSSGSHPYLVYLTLLASVIFFFRREINKDIDAIIE